MSGEVNQEDRLEEWQGPKQLEFKLDKNNDSLRYNAKLVTTNFTFYTPPVFVGAVTRHDAPDTIFLTLGSASTSNWETKFKSEVRETVENVLNYLVYEFEEEMVNSIRYIARDLKSNNAVYIPNEFFGGLKYPDKVFVSLNLIT